MSDLLLEIIRTAVVFVLLVYTLSSRHNKVLPHLTGWRYIQAGFILLFISNLLDITDNFPALDRFVILGNTPGKSFIEKIICGVGGFLLLTIGFWKWLPLIDRLHRARGDLADSRRDLTQAHDRLRIILDSLDEGVVATDDQGVTRIVNPSAARMLGAEMDALLNRPLEDILRLDDIEGDGDIDSYRIGFTGEVQKTLVNLEGRSLRVALQTATLTQEAAGTVVAFRDITGKHEHEMMLRHSSKMESVGRLAGGIAHDFNNQLMGILGNAEFLLMDVKEPEQLECLTAIQTAGRRAAELTSQLLAFSREGLNREEPVDLLEIMTETKGILSRSLDKQIEIIGICDQDDPIVLGEATQLQSAMLNLGINAGDAMPDGGRLTMSISENPNNRDEVRIEISDTGTGMDRKTVGRIFEPFFTTKGIGKGTGLGLASVYGTVTQHKGRISVDSAPGVGSTFTIDLPKGRRTETPGADIPVGSGLAQGTGHILIIDDDELARGYLQKLLQRNGYRASACRNCRELADQMTKADYDGAILDMIMPMMSGPQVFRELRRIRADLPIVLVSGYGLSEDLKALLEEKRTAYLQKPIEGRELMEKLRQVLAESPTAVQ